MIPRIVVVEPVSSGNALVTQARALGWEVLVASYDQGDRTLAPVVRSHATEILTVDTADEAALEAILGKAHDSVPLSGIVAGCEFYVDIVARVAATLGLPGLDPATVGLVRNKARMRAAVAGAGLACPRFASVGDLAPVDEACAHVGFPAVVKPVEAAGSIHVRRVDDLDAARAAVAAIRQDMAPALGRQLSRAVIIEQYLPGAEFSADGYVRDGAVHVAAVTRKVLGPEPYFVEIGHVTPATLDDAVTAAISAYTADVVRAVRISAGIFHCELRLSGGRPVLMEIAARVPGDKIVDLVEMSTGTALPTVALAAAVGADPAALGAFRQPTARVAGIRFITAGGLPTYAALGGWEELMARSWVTSGSILIEPGTPVPAQTDSRGRVAAVMFTADSGGQAEARWAEIGELITINGAA
jgi:biotin carboxylase